AAFFMLLTIKWVITAFAFGLLAVGCVLAWMWETDRLPAAVTTPAAEGIALPIGHVGRHAHSWWATVILLIVDFTVLAAMAFAHVHVSMIADVCPPAGAHAPDWKDIGMPVTGFVLSAAAMLAVGQGRRRHALGRL